MKLSAEVVLHRMRSSCLTFQELTRIFEMYDEGETLIHIARFFEVSRPTIGNYLRRSKRRVRSYTATLKLKGAICK